LILHACGSINAIASQSQFGYPFPRHKGCRRVYICLCNALTDRRLKEAAADLTSGRPSDLYAACGCRAQCGQCAKAMLQLLRDHAPGLQPQLHGAD
jgi:bacterioferritin-associated ferredoxin